MDLRTDLERIRVALAEAQAVLSKISAGPANVRLKASGDPVTEVDTAVNAVLRDILPRDGEAWLSEESAEDQRRLSTRRVWVVDPLDGTREFIAGIPEWCISVGLVVDGQPVAGGVCNPSTGETILGAVGAGVTLGGWTVRTRDTKALEGADVLASRSEYERGEWSAFRNDEFSVRPCGSVAYKLALLAAGRCDATWTLVPKSEWDVVAGVALVWAAGGLVWCPSGEALGFNRVPPRLPSLAASAPGIAPALAALLRRRTTRERPRAAFTDKQR